MNCNKFANWESAIHYLVGVNLMWNWKLKISCNRTESIEIVNWHNVINNPFHVSPWRIACFACNLPESDMPQCTMWALLSLISNALGMSISLWIRIRLAHSAQAESVIRFRIYIYIYIYIEVDQTFEFVGGTHCIDGLGHVKLHATGQFAILMLDFA